MCSYGHQNMKPTVVFGSSWEPQDMTFRMWKHAHACIIMCDLNHHDSKPYRVTVHCAKYVGVSPEKEDHEGCETSDQKEQGHNPKVCGWEGPDPSVPNLGW